VAIQESPILFASDLLKSIQKGRELTSLNRKLRLLATAPDDADRGDHQDALLK